MAQRVRVPLSFWVYGGAAVSIAFLGFAVFIAAQPDGVFGALGTGGLVGSLLKALDEWKTNQQEDINETN